MVKDVRKMVAFNEVDKERFAKVKDKLPFKYQNGLGFSKFVHDCYDRALEKYEKC